MIRIIVKIFRKRLDERGEPNKLLLAEKLASPELSSGILMKIIKIKRILVKNTMNLSIFLFIL